MLRAGIFVSLVATFSLATAHEGDWERITVFLDADSNPTHVRFFYHHWYVTIPWGAVSKVGTHPIVLVAEEGHGSYPADMDVVLHLSVEAQNGADFTGATAGDDCNFTSSHHEPTLEFIRTTFDQCADDAQHWDTWPRLVNVRDQPWYGYGGAWGEVGAIDDTTGPMGPHPKNTGTGPRP